jgi:hypothetical protein
MAFHVDSLARDYARDGLSDVDARGRVANERRQQSPHGQDDVIVDAAGFDHLRAGFTCPQLTPGRLLKRSQTARVVHVRLRVQEHFDVLDVEAELRDARQDQRWGCGITAVDQDVARQAR